MPTAVIVSRIDEWLCGFSLLPQDSRTSIYQVGTAVLRTDTADGVNAQIRGGTFEEVKPNVSCIKMYADGSQQCPYSHVEPCMITFCLLS
jgi:hypothetical protein